MSRLHSIATFTNRLRQLRWRLTASYALVALASVLMVEWWGLVGASLFLSGELGPLEVVQIITRVAWEIVLPTALALLIPVALVGALFGQIMARWLDGRLEILSEATRAWQAGDFSPRVRDSTGDEITELAGRLNDMAAQLQSTLEARQALAALDERNRLARELHDSVKQEGLAAVMQLGAARARLPADPQAALTHLQEADSLVHQMQQELTGLIWELRPVGLGSHNLPAALQSTLENWSRQTGIPYQLSLTDLPELPDSLEETFFRIVQEALANVARHSRAGSVQVAIQLSQGQAVLSVKDDGIGFEPAAVGQSELGLRSMRERTAANGGNLTVESNPGQGTQITASFPIPIRGYEETK